MITIFANPMSVSTCLSSLILATVFLFSCETKYGYYQMHDLSTSGWSSDDSLVFLLEHSDGSNLSASQNLNATIRIVDGEYKYENIILLFSTGSEKDTIHIPLQNDRHYWNGECHSGICEITTSLDNLDIAIDGVERLVVQQWSEGPPLQGIVSLGLFTLK